VRRRGVGVVGVLAALSGAVPAAWAFAIPWAYDGYTQVPTLWFGANASGLDNTTQLGFVAQHSLAGYGWQQGTNKTGFRYIETQLAQAATNLKTFSPSTPVFVYRHSQAAFPMFEGEWYLVAEVVAGNQQTVRDYFITAPNGSICAQGAPSFPNSTYQHAYPFNWSAPGPLQLWTQSMTLEVSLESSVDAVFHDEGDWSYCSYFTGGMTNCTKLFNATTLQGLYRSKITGLQAIGLQLNAAGIVPIFSSQNLFSAVLNPSVPVPCVLPEDDLVAGLGGVTWLRFYEFWVSETSPAENAAMILNAILETNGSVAVGAPAGFVARYNYNATSGLDGVTFALASFLIAQSDYSYFGVSTGWYDANWQWWPQYDSVRCGAPTGPAVVVSAYVFERSFANCHVTVDTLNFNGTIA
jgi:Hypothetical glycosyl hydrolase family 15